jgi:hypothetical protein
MSEEGRKLIKVAPFDDAPNPNGLYVLAICTADMHQLPRCEFDAFLVNDQLDKEHAYVAGATYYDANTDGHLNPGEGPISDLEIFYHGDQHARERVAMDGTFAIELEPDEYTMRLERPRGAWMQTGNVETQAVMFDRAVVALNNDMSYGLSMKGGSVADGVLFGGVCLGEGGARTAAWWGGLRDLRVLGLDDLAMLRTLHLVDAKGSAFDPDNIKELQAWFNAASASNMASQLSVQLAAMALNVHNAYVVGEQLAYTPDIRKANENGFATIHELMAEADRALEGVGDTVGIEPTRIHQEQLKSALADANDNVSFVQNNALSCGLEIKSPELGDR